MAKTTTIFILIILGFAVKNSNAQHITFETTIGDTDQVYSPPFPDKWTYFEVANDVIETSDSGFAFVGYQRKWHDPSMCCDPEYTIYYGRTDAYGDTLWTRKIGNSTNYMTEGTSIIQTGDGGFILSGYTNVASIDYAWLLKTDANGDTTWTKKMVANTSGYDIETTSDGGYLLVGTDGWGDAYIVKTDANGDTLWTNRLGGSIAYSAEQTTDNGYIVAGVTYTGGTNMYVIKTDALGDTLWTRKYGGTGDEEAFDIHQTTDGGYIIGGYTDSYGLGSRDWYLVKTDAAGDTSWTKTYGGTAQDELKSVQQTSDGGYILTGFVKGFTTSSQDVYVVKTDALGDTLWTKVLGDATTDVGYSVIQTSDGGYMAAGFTNGFGTGIGDAYFMKLNRNGCKSYPTTITYSDNDTICSNDTTITLSLANSYLSYDWSTNETSNTIIVDTTGIFYAEVVDNNACILHYTDTLDLRFFTLPNVTITPGPSILFCYGDSTILDAGTGFIDYQWSNSDTTSSTYAIDSLIYSVMVTDSNSCQNSDSIQIHVSYPNLIQEICLITVDISGANPRNLIVWEKPITTKITSFTIYRDVIGLYTPIANVEYDSLSQYTDTTSGVDPTITSYRYRISTIDTCGNESILGAFHETIHLTASVGVGNTVNLVWDAYEGFSYGYFRILRDSTGLGNYEVLDSVANTNFTYTDLTPPLAGNLNYLIEIVLPALCTSTKAQDHNTTRSNRHTMAAPGPDGIGELSNNLFNVYPNPASEDVFVEIYNPNSQLVSISVTNVLGQNIISDHFKGKDKYIIDGSKMESGVYQIKIRVGEKTFTEKLIYK